MTRLAFATALLLTVALAAAQIPNMEPPTELKKFDWMIGTWSGNVKMSFEGMDMEGVMTYNVSKSGQFIKMSSVWDAMGMKMMEDAYVGWDAGKGKYSCHTFTNMAPTPRVEWGEVKGDTQTWISEPWAGAPGAPPTVSRASLTRVSNTQMKFTLEFKAGDTWTKVGDGVFKKK